MKTILPPQVGRLNPTRTVLLRVIKLTTGICLKHSAEKYFILFDKWVKYEGKRSALLRAKQIHHTVSCYLLNQNAPNYPFLSTTMGFPTAVIGLKKFESSPEGIQSILSVTGHFRGILAPGKPDLTPITELGPEVPDVLIAELVSQAPISWSFDIDKLSTVRHEFRTRMGPNGQALTSSALDVIALTREPKLMDHLLHYLDFFDNEVGEDLRELSDVCTIGTKSLTLVSSRISVKKEYGGKDRLFAMCDYWTQITLHPLHDKLASILKTIASDATFGQDTAASAIKEWTKLSSEPLYSLDLTSATDRFPVKAISAMIGKLTNSSEFGNAWKNLIADRDFIFLGKKVKWSVGQPLGAYSSWPSFALCHHLVVKLAAKRAKITSPKYRILGDDVVIVGTPLANHYISIMTELGVKFSAVKSVTGPNRAEFAKRIFLKGNEISPLPIKLIQSSLSNFLLCKTLHETLLQKSSNHGSLPSILPLERCYRGFHSPVISSKVALLVSFPFRRGTRIIEEDRLTLWSNVTFPSDYATTSTEYFKDFKPFSSPVSRQELALLYFITRYRYIKDSYNIEMKSSKGFPETLMTIELPGLEPEDRRLHPIFHTLDFLAEMKAKNHRDLGSFWSEARKKGVYADFPNVNLPDARVFTLSHQAKEIREAKVIMKTYTALVKYGEWKSRQINAANSPDEVINFIQGGNLE